MTDRGGDELGGDGLGGDERGRDGPRGANGVRLGALGLTKAAQAARPVETILVGGRNRRIQKRAPQTGGWNKARRKVFLEALATSCNVRAAAAATGMSISNVYLQRAKDPAFAAAWVEALALGYDRLHAALLRMALKGVEAEEKTDGDGRDAEDGVDVDALPEPVLNTADSVRLALALLDKHRATALGGPRKPGTIVRATPAETDAALRKLLDGLARRSRAAEADAVADTGAAAAVAALPAPRDGAEPRG